MSELSRESIGKILMSVDVSSRLLKDIVTTAYLEGELDIYETIYKDDEEFTVIFQVDNELFKIDLERNSYGDIAPSYGSKIKGPLQAIEKMVTVYE